jgi:HlyD family secretion protein
MKVSRSFLWWLGLGVLVLALLFWFVWPKPVLVETAKVEPATVVASFTEDGETRAHERYVVAAPVAGRLLRVDLHEGDPVRVGQRLAQLAPAPLAAGERGETLARLLAAQALLAEAEQRAARARAEHAQAVRDRRRIEDLLANKFVSAQALEQAQLNEATLAREADAAAAHARAAAGDVAAVRALLASENAKAPLIALLSPADGRVLRVVEQSERVLPAGTPVVTVGDPTRLEAVVDVLSSDGARLAPGTAVVLSEWGGAPFEARVRLVEPAAFTKVSALGVEEQRVNAILDLPQVPPGLGDAFRVEARFIVGRKDAALSVPVGALFKRGEQWSVFAIEGGRARLRAVELGLRGNERAEVLKGLATGESVVVYPGNDLSEGARVRAR